MNKRLFIGIFFLVSLCFMVGQSYACPILRAVITPPEIKWAHQGYAIMFNGSTSVGAIVKCTWSLQPEGEVISKGTERYPDDMVVCKFSTPGVHTVTLTVEDSEERTHSDTCQVNVVAVNMVPGSHELQWWPNVLIPFNYDDDDCDGVPDRDQDGTVAGEDDLLEIQLSVAPTDLPGEVQLTVGGHSAFYTCLKVWSDPDKQNMIIPNGDPPIRYHARWSPAELPPLLYVEGFGGTAMRSAWLSLFYIAPDEEYVNPPDWAYFTVVEVDVDMNGVKDDDYYWQEVTEEITPGGFIALNDDDDNNNEIPDKDEDGPVSGEDDLVKITLYQVSPIDLTGNVTLDVTAGGSKIKIWENETKGGTPLSLPAIYATPSGLPEELWVEGVETSLTARDIELVLQYLTFDDRIKVTIVKVDVNAGLSEPTELDPGKYINVNWDDDDEDGWQPNDNPPEGVYIGDKSDPEINGGDSDFRSFTVSISPWDIPIYFPNSKVSITFPSNVKVWETNTKKTVLGDSSELTSGAQFVVENLPKQLYLEGISGSAEFRDVELKATWLPRDFSDIVNVTVFEADLTGLFGYGNQQEDNDKKHSTFEGSSDKNGKISWDDADADGIKGDHDLNCRYFHNCMECQGTVKPSGVTTEVSFDFDRKKWGKRWKKLEGGSWTCYTDHTGSWWPDDTTESDEDKTPSATDHIYHIDGPGWTIKSRSTLYDKRAKKYNFLEWVEVEIEGTSYQCSDYYKWYSQLFEKPKNGAEMTRDSHTLQKHGGGWITIGNSPE